MEIKDKEFPIQDYQQFIDKEKPVKQIKNIEQTKPLWAQKLEQKKNTKKK